MLPVHYYQENITLYAPKGELEPIQRDDAERMTTEEYGPKLPFLSPDLLSKMTLNMINPLREAQYSKREATTL